MKIGEQSGVEPRLTPRSVGGDASDVRPAAGTPSGADAGGDQVKLSDVARALAKLIAGGTPGHGDQSARVEELRTAVASGRYEPDLEGTARKLIAEAAAERRR